jgi:hypothetical protein
MWIVGCASSGVYTVFVGCLEKRGAKRNWTPTKTGRVEQARCSGVMSGPSIELLDDKSLCLCRRWLFGREAQRVESWCWLISGRWMGTFDGETPRSFSLRSRRVEIDRIERSSTVDDSCGGAPASRGGTRGARSRFEGQGPGKLGFAEKFRPCLGVQRWGWDLRSRRLAAGGVQAQGTGPALSETYLAGTRHNVTRDASAG